MWMCVWSCRWEVMTVSTLGPLLIWIKACKGLISISAVFYFKLSVKRARLLLFVQTTVKVTYSHSVLAFLGTEWPSSASILLQKCNPTDYYDDDEKALRSRSAASPGEMAPLVTLSSRWGRASLTLGWSWKWRRTFSWIKLHIQTFCWALRRPCNSPLANMASRYDSILAQTSGMPSLVCEEARTTWGGSWGGGSWGGGRGAGCMCEFKASSGGESGQFGYSAWGRHQRQTALHT